MSNFEEMENSSVFESSSWIEYDNMRDWVKDDDEDEYKPSAYDMYIQEKYGNNDDEDEDSDDNDENN